MSEYTIQAQNFLDKHGITFNAEFVKNDFHFEGDKDRRDIYKCTFTRKSKSFSLVFGQSLNDSGFYAQYGRKQIPLDRKFLTLTKSQVTMKCKALIGYHFLTVKSDSIHYPIEPTAYSVLACITKYDPIDFENFCSEYGYDTDSMSAKRTFEAVDKEYVQVIKFFSEQEIEELQEIQ